jgi:hypothetical protein
MYDRRTWKQNGTSMSLRSVTKETYREGIQSFIYPTNAHLNCFKMLKFTLKITINAPTCFGLTKPSSGSLQSVLR